MVGGDLRSFCGLVGVEHDTPGGANTISLRVINLAQLDRVLKLGIAGHGIPAVTDQCVMGHDSRTSRIAGHSTVTGPRAAPSRPGRITRLSRPSLRGSPPAAF